MLAALEQPWNPGECLPYDRAEIKKSGHAAKDMSAGIIREMRKAKSMRFFGRMKHSGRCLRRTARRKRPMLLTGQSSRLFSAVITALEV